MNYSVQSGLWAGGVDFVCVCVCLSVFLPARQSVSCSRALTEHVCVCVCVCVCGGGVCGTVLSPSLSVRLSVRRRV